VVLGDRMDMNDVAVAAVAIAATFVIRVVSRWRNWAAPTAKGLS
jgi:hypothetical protein